MKTFCFLLITLIASIFWGMYLSATYKYEYALNNIQTITSNAQENTKLDTTDVTVKPVATTSVAKAQKPVTNVIAKPKCGDGGACVVTDIAPHNTKEDCWVYLSPINKVYDVTDYVSNPKEHPGGDVIVPYCGTNIYDVFIKKAGGHAHSDKALETILEAYYLAPFQS